MKIAMTNTEILICAVIVTAVMCGALFLILVLSAENARIEARKAGLRTPHYSWWLYRRHIESIQSRFIGPIICFFRGHKHRKIFIWEMSSPGEGYCQGHCSRCGGIHHIHHPVPMNDSEELAWLEDNYPDARIYHLGSHAHYNHKRGDPLRCVSTRGTILSDNPPEYGGPRTGHMDCFWHEVKAKR